MALGAVDPLLSAIIATAGTSVTKNASRNCHGVGRPFLARRITKAAAANTMTAGPRAPYIIVGSVTARSPKIAAARHKCRDCDHIKEMASAIYAPATGAM